MYYHVAPTTARPHLLCFRKKAHSGAHSWHIRAHSGTFWHIRAILEIPGCEPDLQKPTFSRSGGRRRGTFAARTPTFYNIKKGDGERRQPGSRILLRTRARVCMRSPCPRPRVADPPLPPSRPGEQEPQILSRLSHLSVTDRCESLLKFGTRVAPPPPAGGPARCPDRRSADQPSGRPGRPWACLFQHCDWASGGRACSCAGSNRARTFLG